MRARHPGERANPVQRLKGARPGRDHQVLTRAKTAELAAHRRSLKQSPLANGLGGSVEQFPQQRIAAVRDDYAHMRASSARPVYRKASALLLSHDCWQRLGRTTEVAGNPQLCMLESGTGPGEARTRADAVFLVTCGACRRQSLHSAWTAQIEPIFLHPLSSRASSVGTILYCLVYHVSRRCPRPSPSVPNSQNPQRIEHLIMAAARDLS